MSMAATAIKQDELAQLPPMQGVALFEAATTLTDVIDALLCQPRFDDGRGMANAAGSVLSDLRDQVAAIADAAMAAAAAEEPSGRYDRQFWAAARIRHDCDRSEDAELLVTFAQILAARALAASTLP
ncbi:MAG: hypothetical protein B7Z40_15315 [Bosea sp. 12-68-7]|nr:MAG: hypothetical protein B7Z40_15315 [Bosea sp. 12-68-7]